MKRFKYLLTGLLVSYAAVSWSQQETLITQFTEHMNIINPAYVGADAETLVTSTIRSQWTGIVDAPEAQMVSFGTSVGKNVGLGLSMLRERTFIERQTFVGMDFSYKVKISESTDLYLGLKAGGNFYDINVNGLNTYNLTSDPSLININRFTPNIGAGIYLKKGDWSISFSSPRLFNTEKASNADGIVASYIDRPHLYVASGYVLALNRFNTLSLQPSFLLRYVNGAPMSVDINTMLSFNNLFKIGATYRTSKAYAGIASFELNKHLIIGFAYEISTRRQLAVAKSTNELLLKFKL